MRLLTPAILAMLVTAGAYAEKPSDDGCRGNCSGGEPSTAIAGSIAGSKSGASSIAGSKSGASSKSGSKSGASSKSSADQSTDVSSSQSIGDQTIIDEGEVNTTTNINNTEYKIPAHADAGIAFAMLQGCYGIGGVDARGSGSNSAGGLTMNIFKLTNDRCVLAAKALEAQANGNLSGYATMTCADKATWKGYQTVMSAMEERKVTKTQAIQSCVKETTEVALLMSQRITNLEAEMNDITINKLSDDELRARVELLETAAHKPDSKKLLVEKEH